jgi:hypothetical protein
MVLMMSPRMASWRSVCSRAGFRIQQAGPVGSARARRSSFAALPSSSRRSFGSSALVGLGLRSATPPDASEMSRSPRVETGPALGINLAFKTRVNLMFATWPELEGDAVSRPVREAAADVFAADDEVLTIIRATTKENIDVGIVRIPVIDRDPVEPGAEIGLDVAHQLARERPQVTERGSVFWRDDELEMVAIILATRGERALIRHVGSSIEHPGISAIPRHALPFQIGHVLGQGAERKRLPW